MRNVTRNKRLIATLMAIIITVLAASISTSRQASAPEETIATNNHTEIVSIRTERAALALEKIAIKGRAPKTDYAREQFSDGWAEVDGCDMRNFILARDIENEVLDIDGCRVVSGTLHDPYTATTIQFQRGSSTSSLVQIDHVVALSDAWQKGAQSIDVSLRAQFANDPLNLLAVDGTANQQKSDSDAASWLPSSNNYRCSYVARQIAVKLKYHLWVTGAERDAMASVLQTCPDQILPSG